MIRWLLLLGALTAPAHAASLREGFEAALGLSAELRGLEAQRGVYEARTARAGALLPAAPSVQGGVRSDAIFQDRGYLQLEAGAVTPVWLPGEGRALAGSASAGGAQNAGQIARARLLLAGEVRTTYWAWSIAAAEQAAQTARVAQARALENEVGRTVRGGNAPRTDLLVATAAVREAEGLARERAQAAREAAIAFRVLTGADPTSGPEETPAGDAARPDIADPRLRAAQAAIDAGRAGEALARVRDRENPQLGAQLRLQRDTRSDDLATNLLVYGRLPLRYGPGYREALAEARATTLTAEAELATAERTLAGTVDRAREQRDAARDLARLAEARHAALSEQTRLYETAYRGGELALIEVVRVRAQLADADAARRRARAEGGRAASEINQVLGLEPR